MLEDKNSAAVKPVQPILSAEPHESLAILHDGIDSGLWETFFERKMIEFQDRSLAIAGGVVEKGKVLRTT